MPSPGHGAAGPSAARRETVSPVAAASPVTRAPRAGETAVPGTPAAGLRVAMLLVAAVGFAAAAAGIAVPATDGLHAAVDETQYLLTAISLAEDGELDIADELADRRWQSFADDEPPVQTAVRPDGRAISPHDPLLPLLLAAPVAAGGWVGAKLALATVAGALAALMLWTAVCRFAVPVRLAVAGVGIAAASAPLAVYGQQIYPELPAACAVLAGVAALTGAVDRRHLALLAVVVGTVPWLSVKYLPVVAALAALGVHRWWRAERRADVLVTGGMLAAAGVAYLAVHRAVWGGWTVYASGDHFVGRGELSVIGDDVHLSGRALRLVALLVDRDYGLATWQPAYLLAVPAASALLARYVGRRSTRTPAIALASGTGTSAPRLTALGVPLAVGWLVATFVAATMHGYWWPGRHVVVVLPLAVLAVLAWLASGTAAGGFARLTALVLGATGVLTYLGLLAAGHAGAVTWVRGPAAPGPPWQVLLPDYRGPFWVPHLVCCAVLVGLAVTAIRATRHSR